MAINREVGSSGVEIGINSDSELQEALSNVEAKADEFASKFEMLKSFFSTTGEGSHLWQGPDADAFREVVTTPNTGIIDKLNKFSLQMENMGKLASEMRRVINEAQAQLKANIKDINGGS